MGLTYGLIALAAVLGAFTVALFSRVRALSGTSERLRKDYDGAREQIRELAEKERKASAKLDERTDEIQSLKKELGAQKKKAFATNEELKSLKSELKSAKEAAHRASHARPAFADEPKKEKAPAREPQTPPAPDRSAEIAALEERLASLEEAKTSLVKKVSEAEGELRQAQSELRKAKRRVDEYRRADQVGRSRAELTDDKLRYLSRQYYEVVSELAALKGDVAPPPPRELEDVRREAAEVERAPVRAAVGQSEGDAIAEVANGIDEEPASAAAGPSAVENLDDEKSAEEEVTSA